MLEVSIDYEHESNFRFLVDDTLVKYVTIDHGLWSVDDLAFAPVLLPQLPPLPPGDWNVGRISKDPTSGQPVFVEANRDPLPTVQHTWHHRFFNILDLKLDEKLLTNVYLASCPAFDVPVIAKFASFPWQTSWLEDETRAYEWIEGKDVGPRFLGHLLENGRVSGFLMERVLDARHAGPEHLSLCQEAVRRLHRLGIRHGDLNKYNMLIAAGRATLIDFDAASKCEDTRVLEEEYDGLLDALKDMSGRGIPIGAACELAEQQAMNSSVSPAEA